MAKKRNHLIVKDDFRKLHTLKKEYVQSLTSFVKRFQDFLSDLVRKEPENYEDARTLIETIRRFARVTGQELLFDGRPITFHLVLAKRSRRPTIQLLSREAGKQKSVYAKVVFPSLTLRVGPDLRLP